MASTFRGMQMARQAGGVLKPVGGARKGARVAMAAEKVGGGKHKLPAMPVTKSAFGVDHEVISKDLSRKEKGALMGTAGGFLGPVGSSVASGVAAPKGKKGRYAALGAAGGLGGPIGGGVTGYIAGSASPKKKHEVEKAFNPIKAAKSARAAGQARNFQRGFNQAMASRNAGRFNTKQLPTLLAGKKSAAMYAAGQQHGAQVASRVNSREFHETPWSK